MKHVKRISLFFVYPICMLLVGIWIGTNKNEEVNAPIKLQEDIAEHAETNSSTEQFVMNHEAVVSAGEAEQSQIEPGYFVCLKDGCVIVYLADRETIFLSTEIRHTELPEAVRRDLELGIYMSDEGMLYGFLENYTS